VANKVKLLMLERYLSQNVTDPLKSMNDKIRFLANIRLDPFGTVHVSQIAKANNAALQALNTMRAGLSEGGDLNNLEVLGDSKADDSENLLRDRSDGLGTGIAAVEDDEEVGIFNDNDIVAILGLQNGGLGDVENESMDDQVYFTRMLKQWDREHHRLGGSHSSGRERSLSSLSHSERYDGGSDVHSHGDDYRAV